MAQQGWISLHRKIKESWIWLDTEPFDRRSAWVDILLSANHEGKKISVGNTIINVERGSFITSEVKLAQRWKWSRKKVRRFLEVLELDKMLSKKSTSKYTSLTVENYDLYQGEGTTKEQQKNIKGTSKEHQRNTNNNDNNDNNENNDNKNIYTSDSKEYRLADYLYRFILSKNDKAKKPNFQSWSKQFDLILRVDKREFEEVKDLIKYCQNDSFWYKNILSPSKLREKYDQLILNMKDKKKPKQSNGKTDNFNNFEQRTYNFDELEKKLLGWDENKEE